MTLVLVLNILLISDICQSFKPNFYNGRYFTRDIKPAPTTLKPITGTSTNTPVRESKNYHNSNKTRNLQKNNSSVASTTLKPSSYQVKEKVSDPHLETQILAHTGPYTAGYISNILNRFGSTPVLAHKFGSYQSQIEFESPRTTATGTDTTASMQSAASSHPNRQPNSESSSWRGTNPAAVALVRAASLNTDVFHQPHNETGEKDQPLSASLPAFQYEQTIVHNNEPKHMNFVPLLRKQRNLNENLRDFDEKFSEYDQTGGNNETQHAGQHDDDNDDHDDDADETMILAETSREHPHVGDEMRYFHDIFLNYPQPHHAHYGHVQFSPQLFEKRFESSKEGNRYKGEILWKDNEGGYAEHHWDMALGNL